MAGFEVGQPWELPGPADESTATESSMMSNTRNIPETEWLVHKEEIQFMYSTENRTREEVMAAMEKTHGFQASKAQYTRIFEQWGFKKNSTGAKWKFIAQKLHKRNLEGKESDTYLDGRLVPRKKVKREVLRHFIPSWQIMSTAGRSPPPPAGIEIRTPPQEHKPFVQYLHIPWFEFEMLVEPQINRLVALASEHHKSLSFYEEPAQISHNPLTWAPSPKTGIATDQSQHQTIAPEDSMCDVIRRLGNDKWVQEFVPSIQVRQQASSPILARAHDQEARSLFANILGKYISPNSYDYLSTVTSHLDDILIERQDGDIARNLQKLFGSSTFEITIQLLRYSVYLSSNNLLSEDKTDKLLKWVVQSGQFAVIEHLIRLKIGTTEVFASNILLSAVRIGDIPTVRALIALGIDVNIPGGCYPKDLALLIAVRDSIKERLWRRQATEFPLVTLLLEAGADINAKSGLNKTSPLQEVISKRHVQLVQMFLNSENTNGLANELGPLHTTLRKAARDGDSNLMKRILGAKANLDALTQLSMITLLQDAARWHDIDTIQALLDIGADVNAPAGIVYEAARKAAVKSKDLWSLQSAIQIAAYQGEIEVVQALLEAGANVDGYFLTQEEYSVYETVADRFLELDLRYPCDDDYSHLSEDPICKDDDEVRYCDDECIYCPHFYWTPLQSAVGRKDSVLVRVLLVAGANVEGRGLGLTPLQLAAHKDETQLVRLLLKHGADVNAPARGFKGRTALQAATENGNTDLVEILLDAGSDLNAAASPNSGYTALQAAGRVNNFELVSKLISLGADVNAAASPIDGRTCLQAAAEMGHSESVQILLNSGAKVNAAGAAKYGFTALQAAARAGNLSVVKMLLAAGADIHTPSTDGGLSAVSAAIVGNNLEIVQLFLKTANPDGQADLLPPLLRASRRRKTEMVKCLVKAGANVNALRIDKPSLGSGCAFTALEAALDDGYEDIFYILWDAVAGCNGDVPDLGAALGAASTHWCSRRKSVNMDIVHKLLDAGADVNRAFSTTGVPLHNAVYCERSDLVQILLDAGADVNGRAPDGKTALLNAVRIGDTDIIQTLLNAGADIEAYAPIKRGRTALQYAAQRGKATVVRFLLERGADCNAPAADSSGATALQAAAIGGNLPIVLMLLKAGANINAPAAKIDGRKALDAAAEHGRLDIVSLLLENDTDTDGLRDRCECAAKLAEKNGHIFIAKMLRGYKN